MHPDIREVLGSDVAVVALCHVDYRSGFAHDGSDVTAAVHDVGGLMLWDLSHSAGALDIRLEEWGADFAVGCSYKYLNAGPVSSAYIYVHRRLHHLIQNPLPGWHGHAEPFALDPTYRPTMGIGRMQTGAQPIIAVAAVDAALDAFEGVSMPDLRATSLSLTDLFIDLVERRCEGHPLTLITPRNHGERGSQVSIRHPEGGAVMQALIARGVIGDYREPEVLRFGLTPLFLRYADVWDAVDTLADVLDRDFAA